MDSGCGGSDGPPGSRPAERRVATLFIGFTDLPGGRPAVPTYAARSKMAAMPCPPPMHMVSRP